MTRQNAQVGPAAAKPMLLFVGGAALIAIAALIELREIWDALARSDTEGTAISLMLLPHVAGFVCAAAGLSLWLIVLRTARDRRDHMLAEMSRRLDLAMGVSNIGFWDADLVADRLRWDERACQLMGVEPRPGYFSEADWLGAVHPEDRARAGEAARAAVDGSSRFTSDYRVVWPDGQVRHLRDMATYYRGHDGAPRLIGLVWDVTADKERELELEEQRRQAEAANLAKSNFLAAMSHEVRTPLAGVIGMLDLLREEEMPAAQAECVRIASDSAHSLLRLLNDVLDVSKLEAGAIAVRPEPTDIRRLLADVGELMSARARQKHLRLTWTASDAVPRWVGADPLRLRQVLTNLVSNAITFTEKGGVDIALDWAAGRLECRVRDSGVGIAPADRSRIFERFVQADETSRRRPGGTGLGLAIVRELVTLMGGGIDLESTPGTGSTFRFDIDAPEVVELAGDAAAPQVRSEGSVVAAPLRILVADDNATNRHLMRTLLEKRGHDVVFAHDGAEAVEAARVATFDLVLMDLQMPRMDGIEAARAIRDLPGAERLPIVALTASAVMLDRAKCESEGFDGCLGKPVDRAALNELLATTAERRRREPGPSSRAAG
jgi:signal transduction histidine kinase/ActR/RegA family two-component response regulator